MNSTKPTPLAKQVNVKTDCYGEPPGLREVTYGGATQHDMNTTSKICWHGYHANKDRDLLNNRAAQTMELDYTEEDAKFYNNIPPKPTNKPYSGSDFVAMKKSQEELKSKQRGTMKELLNETPEGSSATAEYVRPYRTVTPSEAAQFSETFDASKIKQNKDTLCLVNVDMKQTFDNSVLEERANNAVLRKRLHMREDLVLKPNQVATSPNGGGFLEAERIRQALNHSHLEFHKPGYDVEHRSSSIMSNSREAVQSTLTGGARPPQPQRRSRRDELLRRAS